MRQYTGYQKLSQHTLIMLAHRGTLLVRKSEENANLVNRLYLVNMLKMVLSWSKIDKARANVNKV